jgi:hypothetical protein
MRLFVLGVAFVASALSVAGCTTSQVGPIRPITIADDVAYARPLAEPDLSTFYGAPPGIQAEMRNQILTARMYIADIQYHYYEARLTREMQEEGLAATLASLGLTTAVALVPAAQTKAILGGTAAAVIGADKAYNEKQLLSNTIQALQTQMRGDRKAQAAVIYAKMFRDGGGNTKTLTPIFEYTLPMALSDSDGYYQAGTIASALIGLSKTLANAERNADQAKSDAGPNPVAVSNAKEVAAPHSGNGVVPTLRVTNVARDNTYTDLRSLLFPNGSLDPALVAYVRKLLGNDKVAIGPILAQAEFAPLRRRLSACIVARRSGSPCADGSLSQFVQ